MRKSDRAMGNPAGSATVVDIGGALGTDAIPDSANDFEQLRIENPDVEFADVTEKSK